MDRQPKTDEWRRFIAPALVVGVLMAIVFTVVRAPSQGPRPEQTDALGTLADPIEVYDPVREGEQMPPGYRAVIGRDWILPVYDPQFITGSLSPWSPEALVIGLTIDGESKAYPVGFLNRREMVIDRLAGIPVLVTW